MPSDLHLKPAGRVPVEERLTLATGEIPMLLVRNPRARRYTLRMRPNGSARVTIPRGGSIEEGRRFAGRNTGWVERMLLRLAERAARPREWILGTMIHFRGELVAIETDGGAESGLVRFATETVKVKVPAADLRPGIDRHLRRLAAKEFPAKVFEHAAAHRLTVTRVTVRNQRSRWGSCSRRGTISLNWRLIQAPPFVRDYLILHELTHLRHMNHSSRFWREVERVCPGYEAAEKWLKEQSNLLR